MGGKAWFRIESKSFKISTKSARRNFSRVITERKKFFEMDQIWIEAFPRLKEEGDSGFNSDAMMQEGSLCVLFSQLKGRDLC